MEGNNIVKEVNTDTTPGPARYRADTGKKHTLIRRLHLTQKVINSQQPTATLNAEKSHLPQLFSQTPFPKLPRIEKTLFREIDALHIRHIRWRGPADARSDQNRIRFKNNSIIDNLVNSQSEEIVVLDNGAFVSCASD